MKTREEKKPIHRYNAEEKKCNRLIVCRHFSPISLYDLYSFRIFSSLDLSLSLSIRWLLCSFRYTLQSSWQIKFIIRLWIVHNAHCALHMRKLTGLPAIYHYPLAIARWLVSMLSEREKKKEKIDTMDERTNACTLDSTMMIHAVKSGFWRKCVHCTS